MLLLRPPCAQGLAIANGLDLGIDDEGYDYWTKMEKELFWLKKNMKNYK